MSINIVQLDNNRHKISLIIFSIINAHMLKLCFQPQPFSNSNHRPSHLMCREKKHYFLANVAKLATGYSWFKCLISAARTDHSFHWCLSKQWNVFILFDFISWICLKFKQNRVIYLLVINNKYRCFCCASTIQWIGR